MEVVRERAGVAPTRAQHREDAALAVEQARVGRLRQLDASGESGSNASGRYRTAR